MSHPTENPHGALYQAFEALERAARVLSAEDVAVSEAALREEPMYRPVTKLVANAASALQDYIAEEVGLVTSAHVGMHEGIAEVTPLRP